MIVAYVIDALLVAWLIPISVWVWRGYRASGEQLCRAQQTHARVCGGHVSSGGPYLRRLCRGQPS